MALALVIGSPHSTHVSVLSMLMYESLPLPERLTIIDPR